jgi:hypothetical protein
MDNFTGSTIAAKTLIPSRLHSTVHCDRKKYSGGRANPTAIDSIVLTILRIY